MVIQTGSISQSEAMKKLKTKRIWVEILLFVEICANDLPIRILQGNQSI